MKKRSIFAKLLVGSALLLNGKLSAQEASPSATSQPIPATDSDPGGGRSVTVSNFLRQRVDQTPSGPASVNTVDQLNVDVKLPDGWTGYLEFGMDWGALKPGLWRTQNMRVEGLSLTKKSGDFFVKGGTIGFWGPPSGNQSSGDINTLVNGGFFDFGEAFPGLAGVRAGGRINAGNMTITLDTMAATGDRGLTGSVAGDGYPSLCQNNHNACGFVGGVNADWQTQTIPGLTATTQFTRVGNEKASNELRSTLGAEYKRKTGPILWSAAAEETYATHYQGGKPNLGVKIATLSAGKELGKNFGIKSYISGTRTQGAIEEQFVLGGADITWHNRSNKLTVGIHDEPFRASHVGTTISWHHIFR